MLFALVIIVEIIRERFEIDMLNTLFNVFFLCFSAW